MMKLLRLMKWKRVIEKSGLFDVKYYLFRYADVRLSNMDPLVHYIKQGAIEGRNPNQNFDTDFYMEEYADVKESGINPLAHYILYGKSENRLKSRSEFIKQIIIQSELFDDEYYLSAYPDIRESGVDPVEHYIDIGAFEGRDPSKKFNTGFYLEQYADVKDSKINPLAHYLLYGEKEGKLKNKNELLRQIIIDSKLFDQAYYLSVYPDISEVGIDPILHYLNIGASEGRDPSNEFETSFYMEQYSKVMEKGFNPLLHYILHGREEGFYVIKYAYLISKIQKSNDGMLLISHDATKSGAPLSILALCQTYKENISNDIVIILMNGGPLENDFAKFGHVINFNVGEFNQDITQSQKIREVFNSLSSLGYNKCLANTVLTGYLTNFFKENCIRTIYFIHELPTLINEHKWIDSAKNIASSSSPIVFACKFVAEKFQESYAETDILTHIIPQAITTSQASYSKESACNKILQKINIDDNGKIKIVLAAGYAHYRKGTDLFLSVAEEIYKNKKMENIHFIWLGERDAYYENFKNTTLSTLKYSNNIHFIDFEKDPSYLFAGSDLFLLTSREDPFPGVALLALQNSLPVIMFENTGGIQELLNETNGNIVPQFDTAIMADKVLERLNKNDKTIYHTEINNALQYSSKVLDIFDTEKTKKVSVIIPNYNYAHFIEQRILTIINQIIKPDEIIFLDDCSTDNSVAVAKDILEKCDIDFQIILNNKNIGVYGQWLKGIKLAKNDLVWIAEADDYSDPHFLSSLLPFFDQKEDIGIAYAQSKIVDENENIIHDNVLFHTNTICKTKWDTSYIKNGKLEIEDALLYRNTIPNVSGCVIDKRYLEGIESELVKYRYVGDWFLYSYILTRSNIAYCKKSLNYFRKHTSNITTLNTYKIKYIQEVLKIKKYIFSTIKVSVSAYKKILNIFETDFLKNNSNEKDIRLSISKDLKILENTTHKHVVFVTFNSEFSGSEVLWYEMSKYLSQKNYKVSVVLNTRLLDPEKKKDLLTKGVQIVENDYFNFDNITRLMPDSVIFSIGDHNDGGDFFKNCYENNISYVIINQLVKEDMWITDPKALKVIFDGYKNANGTFFTCVNNREILERKMGDVLHNSDIHFNPISIDREDYVNFPKINNTFHLAFPARLLTIHKGQDLLIKVLSAKKWQERDIQVNFYGEGPDYDTLLQLTKDLKVNNVQFHGYIDNIRTIWENNHAFILTSHMEGVPIVLLGAMFAGRVSIVTDVGGNKEVLENNITGFIADFPTEVSIDNALEKAWKEREKWKDMGKLARESILKKYPVNPLENFEVQLKELLQW